MAAVNFRLAHSEISGVAGESKL